MQSIALETSGTPAVPTNRMTSVTSGGTTLVQSYDAAGNVINDGVHAYEYDAENRLVTVDKGPNGALASYGYETRRETGRKLRMKEPYREGVATHSGRES